MAYSSQPTKYSQSLQFTYNKTPYDSYATAVRQVTKKNLLPGEPAACFYKNDNDELKMLLAIGTGHGQEKPLILSESSNDDAIYAELEKINDLLGDFEINMIVPYESVIIRTVTEAINYLFDKTIAKVPLDETPEYSGVDDLPGYDGNPEKNIGDTVNILLKAVEYLTLNLEDLVIKQDELEENELYTGEDGWTRVYSAGKINEIITNFSLKNWNWKSSENSGSINLVQNGEPVYIEVDGGELENE